jgi:prolyl-tRNA editing enzyme YbaK/EbsC (Cys-tRNA(Pro) deacylase)
MEDAMADPLVHPRVIEALVRGDIKFEVIPCDPQYADTANFCAAYGFPLETSGNAILVTSTRGSKRYALGVVLATHRLDVNHKMRSLMRVARASFARPEETTELTGMAIGGVTPFGLPTDCPVYFDANLEELEYVVLGAGTRLAKIKVRPGELTKIPNASFVASLGYQIGQREE